MTLKGLDRVMFFGMFVTFAVPPLAFAGAFWWADRLDYSGEGPELAVVFGAAIGYFSALLVISLIINTAVILVRFRGMRPRRLPHGVAIAELILVSFALAWLLDILLTRSATPIEQTPLALGIAAASIAVLVIAMMTPRAPVGPV